MAENPQYNMVEGSRKNHDIRVYALSTCGFCKKALVYLKEQGFAHSYIHLDMISLEEKNKIKQELKSRFGQTVMFPFAVIDDRMHLVGFIEAEWKKALEA